MKKWFDKRTDDIGDSVLGSIRSARDKAMLTVASVLSKLPWGKKSTIISSIKSEVQKSAKMTDALDKYVEKKQDKTIKKAEDRVKKSMDAAPVVMKEKAVESKPVTTSKPASMKQQREPAKKKGPKGTNAWDTRRKLYGPSGRKDGKVNAEYKRKHITSNPDIKAITGRIKENKTASKSARKLYRDLRAPYKKSGD